MTSNFFYLTTVQHVCVGSLFLVSFAGFATQCFTGLAFIDVSELKAEHLVSDNQGNLWIRKARQKTKVMCNIPLLDIPLAILEKYDGHPLAKKKGTLLPVPCNQKLNSYLKEIADLCGIKKNLTTHTGKHNAFAI